MNRVVEATELEERAARLRAADAVDAEKLAEKARAAAAAAAACETAAATFTGELGVILAEIRDAVPGCERWHGRTLAALERYAEVVAEPRAAGGIAVASRFRAERILTAHPIARLLPWLALLADPAQSRETAAPSDDHSGNGPEAA